MSLRKILYLKRSISLMFLLAFVLIITLGLAIIAALVWLVSSLI